MHHKPIGTIQVDLDGLWTNLQYYGHSSELYPDTIFESSIPAFLELFEKYDIKATFFLVGKDALISEKVVLVKEIIKAGHEIANHTYSHTFGFRKLSSAEKGEEIKKGEEIIDKITGKKPVGFKAPGYDVDVETLQLLALRGYRYDSSIIATPFYPAIMSLNRLLSGGIKRTHGPKWSWGLAPNYPYFPSPQKEWRKARSTLHSASTLLELPCSVMPLARMPFHTTFVMKFGLSYFKTAHTLYKKTHHPLNYEFHAADLSADFHDSRLPHLNSFTAERRAHICENIIKTISRDYSIMTSQDLIKKLDEKKNQEKD